MIKIFNFTFFLLLIIIPNSLWSFLYPNLDAFQSGLQYYSNQNYSAATNQFHLALTYDPENPIIYEALANTHQQLAEFDKAAEFYEKAKSTERPLDRLDNLYLNEGNNFFRMEKFQEAIADYQKVLDLDDKNVSAKKNLEIALKKLQEQNSKQQKDQNENDQKNQKDKKDNNRDKDENKQNQNNQNNDSSDKEESQQEEDSNKDSSPNEKDRSGQQEKESGDGQNEKQNETASSLSIKRIEEILKAFSEKELKTKGYEFYQQERSDKKNQKNW